MRGLLLPLLAGLAGIVSPAGAEPLFPRIRPNAVPVEGTASGIQPTEANDEATAAQARALREEVWARADRRARIAIASVCTGCLKPIRPDVAPPAEPSTSGTLSVTDAAPSEPIPTEPPSLPTEGDR